MNKRSVAAANWPAQSEPFAFANVAFSVTVPVVVSTALSMKLSVPIAGDVLAASGGGSSCCAPDRALPAGVNCAGASTGAPVVESAKLAPGAALPGVAVTGKPPCAPYCRMSGNCDAGTAKRTMMGRTWLIVTMAVAPFACTRLPTRTRRLPVLPEIGARIVVLSRLNRAFATTARSARTTASEAADVASNCSPSSFVT